jgi:hypothetical protein
MRVIDAVKGTAEGGAVEAVLNQSIEIRVNVLLRQEDVK